MSKDSILKITAVEKRAEKMLDDAREEARRIVEKAEADGKQVCRDTEIEATKRVTEMLDQIQKRCEELVERELQSAREDAAKMKHEFVLRRNVAEKIVLRGLEAKCR